MFFNNVLIFRSCFQFACLFVDLTSRAKTGQLLPTLPVDSVSFSEVLSVGHLNLQFNDSRDADSCPSHAVCVLKE